jgi:UDP-N-acetylglucosamine 2-epimerase (non-hydrolysing)
MEGILRAIRRAADDLPHLHVVYPVHRQPAVYEAAYRALGDHPRIALVEPLRYLQNVAAMKACSFIVTDSGGIQEEAPFLGKPVLVLRKVTERPEAVEAGTSWLVGTAEEDVYGAIFTLATDPEYRNRMAHAVSPFGDGHASARIVAALRRFAGLPVRGEPPPL